MFLSRIRVELVKGVSRGPTTPKRLQSSASDPLYFVEKTPITVQLWENRMRLTSHHRKQHDTAKTENLEAKNTKYGSPLPASKSPKESIQLVKYMFRSDVQLRNMYTDSKGNILMGKVLQDLDALAGNVAYVHCAPSHLNPDNASPMPALVTASVEKIVLASSIPTTVNMHMVGKVIWVGNSSLDVSIELHSSPAEEEGKEEKTDAVQYLSSIFTYVARDKTSKKAVHVNRLLLQDEEDMTVFTQRQHLAAQRKLPSPPMPGNGQEKLASLLHTGNALQDMPALGSANHVLMRSTSLENSFICQPQNANTANRVFGGFLSTSFSLYIFFRFVKEKALFTFCSASRF